MGVGIGGTWHEDAATSLGAAKLNQGAPHGLVHQLSGDDPLEVRVAKANWFKSDGTFLEYAGSDENSIPTSSTRWVYLDATNALQIGASLPALSNDMLILAKVVSNGSQVTEIHNINMPSQAYRT